MTHSTLTISLVLTSSFVLSEYLQGHQMKEDEMGEACSTVGMEEKYMCVVG